MGGGRLKRHPEPHGLDSAILQEELYMNGMICEVLLIDMTGITGCVILAEILAEAIEIVTASAWSRWRERSVPNTL